MTYTQHMQFSSKLGHIFLRASCKAWVHALLPNVYVTSSSDTVQIVSDLLKTNNCNKTVEKM